MNRGYVCFACMALALILVPAVAAAWHFDYEMYGNILESPARYDGSLTSGGDGTIEIVIDDTDWPSDPGERFDYLWETYFEPNYNSTTPGAYKWVGSFSGRFYLEVTNALVGYNGWCEGGIYPKITIWDPNENGVLDDEEKWGENLFDARLSKFCDDGSGGEMACKFGSGSIASNYFSFKMPPEPDTLYNGSDLMLYEGCPSAATPGSWGSIKSLYK
jgi:hypothetical protein